MGLDHSPESQLDGVTSASLPFCFKGNGPLCNMLALWLMPLGKLWGQGQDEVAGDEEARRVVQNAFLPVVATLEAMRLLDRRYLFNYVCRKKFC